MANEWQEFLRRVVKKFEGRKDFADKVGLSASRITHAFKEDSPHTFSVESCLRLASSAGEDPTTVLKLAGKADVAALIEDLYGKPRPPMGAVDQQLLALPADHKKRLVAFIVGLIRDPRDQNRAVGAKRG